MVKKVVIVKFKKTKKEEVFLTCPEIYLKHNKEELGICLNALWNALSKNNGRYENRYCVVYYRNNDKSLKIVIWD